MADKVNWDLVNRMFDDDKQHTARDAAYSEYDAREQLIRKEIPYQHTHGRHIPKLSVIGVINQKHGQHGGRDHKCKILQVL